MNCLIIAAGMGVRIRPLGESKPLVTVNGIPLIERVMHLAREGGVDRFVIVTGFNGARVRAFLDDFSRRTDTPITHVENENWDQPNGISVLKARPHLQQPFLLLMSDHLFDPTIIPDLTASPPAEGETILAVDHRIDNTLIDLDDVTRVEEQQGRLLRIGKGLPQYNAFDTGIFYSTPGLFDALETSIETTEDASLSGGMRILAAEGKARTFDIGDRFWLDIDIPEEAGAAELLIDDGHLIPGEMRGAHNPG